MNQWHLRIKMSSFLFEDPIWCLLFFDTTIITENYTQIEIKGKLKRGKQVFHIKQHQSHPSLYQLNFDDWKVNIFLMTILLLKIPFQETLKVDGHLVQQLPLKIFHFSLASEEKKSFMIHEGTTWRNVTWYDIFR